MTGYLMAVRNEEEMLKEYTYKGNLMLPPKSDVVFKAIFGSEQNKDLLVAFLNDVLDLDIVSETYLELVNTELPAHDAEGKFSRLDIRAKLKNGQQVNIEIQVRDLKNTIQRGLIYHSKMFASQLTSGMDYAGTRRCISLMILDFNLFMDKKQWYNRFRYKDVETGNELSDLSEIIFLEMPKMKKRCTENESLSKREQWTLFLHTDQEEDLDMLAEKDKNIEKAIDKLIYVSADEKLRFEYEMREKAENDYHSGMAEAERRGREEGARQKAVETAGKLKQKGMKDADIAEITGLSPDEIKEIGEK